MKKLVSFESREKFEKAFLDWKEEKANPKSENIWLDGIGSPLSGSAFESYGKIVKLGNEALPFIIEKLKGKKKETELNQAALTIMKIEKADLALSQKYPSEDDVAIGLVKYYEEKHLSKKKIGKRKLSANFLKGLAKMPKKVTPQIASQYLEITYSVLVELSKNYPQFGKEAEQIKSILKNDAFRPEITDKS